MRPRSSRVAATAMAALAAVLLAGCADGPGGRSGSSATPAGVFAPLSCGTYRVISGDRPGFDVGFLRSARLTAEVERLNGATTVVVNGPVNTFDVPLVPEPGGAITDVEHVSGSAVGCTASAADSACGWDAWLARLLGAPGRWALSGGDVTVTGDAGRMVLRHTG